MWRGRLVGVEAALEIRVLHRHGKSIREIARETGVARNTVRRYLRDEEAGLEIDDQLERRWLLDRQIGGLGALENPAGVDASLARISGEARSIADQAAGRGELAPPIDRRNGIA